MKFNKIFNSIMYEEKRTYFPIEKDIIKDDLTKYYLYSEKNKAFLPITNIEKTIDSFLITLGNKQDYHYYPIDTDTSITVYESTFKNDKILSKQEKLDSIENIKNMLKEDIFKPASPEEVKTRKAQADLEKFMRWVEYYMDIKYEDLFKPENINKKDYYGDTALIEASKYNNIEIVKRLLDNGANINVKNKGGESALLCAKQYDNKDVILLLRQYGAKI